MSVLYWLEDQLFRFTVWTSFYFLWLVIGDKEEAGLRIVKILQEMKKEAIEEQELEEWRKRRNNGPSN